MQPKRCYWQVMEFHRSIRTHDWASEVFEDQAAAVKEAERLYAEGGRELVEVVEWNGFKPEFTLDAFTGIIWRDGVLTA